MDTTRRAAQADITPITSNSRNELLKVRRRLPPLNAIKVFEAVARLGSLTRAVHELSITPSAVSQQVHALEDFVGRKLFVQGKQRLEPTEAACDARADVSHALDLIARAFQTKSQSDTRIAVSSLPAFASRWMNPRLPDFFTINPEIERYVDAPSAWSISRPRPSTWRFASGEAAMAR